jgi:Ca2+-binding EF-hand superfamily protein
VGGLLSSAAGPEFARMDRNRDSLVSRAEWTGDNAVFRRIDVNDDRMITTSEYNSWVNPTPSAAGPEFTRMDRNRDSLISRAEWTGDNAIFRRIDVNDDRIVTTSEYVNYHRALNEGDLVKGPGGALVKDRREFRVLDYDNDGRLTRREWNGDRREFDVMDLNNDGWLSYDEYGTTADDDARAVRFRDLDTNRDGRLTRGELRLDRATFRLLDNNNDGRVTREEFRDTRALDNRFTTLDRDRDGRVERREWQGSLDAFRWFDRDRDGRLTRAEFLS